MKKLLPYLFLMTAYQGFTQNCIDPKATPETANLYRNLHKLLGKGILFGHQDDLAYGVHWKYQKGRSDVKEVTGDYPALYGWELGHLELGKPANLDTVPFDKMRGFIQEGYERGGVITISWHADNPMTGKSAWDPAPGTVASILPGGKNHALYRSWLNQVAAYLLTLTGKKGEAIPILFRPFHELTGNWFWWGKTACTPEEYKQLFRFTVQYLKEEKQLHQLLYVYNTGKFASRDEFLERYPGDDVVDVLSFDDYQAEDPVRYDGFIRGVDANLATLEELAARKHKLPALGETGYDRVPYPQWWTKTLLKAIGNHAISYVLLWRNAGLINHAQEPSYYVPYHGEASAADFKQLYHSGKMLFQKGIAAKNIYAP